MNPDSNKVGVLITTVADNAGIDSTKAGLAEVGTAAKVSSSTATSAFDSFNASLGKVGTQMSSVGRSMTTGLSVPIVAVAGASVKMAMDFQQSMTYVRTDAGDTTDNINTLSNSVLNLAKTSQYGPDALANGLYHLASLGLRGADAMKALNTAQQMAAVGGADLESTASALGGALVSGIDGVQNYTQAAGVLDATVGAGNMRMQDLVNAIGTGVLPVFKNAGLSITDFGAALATLTDNGQQADAAATHLRMTVSLMEAPSQAAASAMGAIGLASNQLGMDMQTKGLIPALKDLQQHLVDTYGTTAEGKQKMAAALNDMFGGGKSSAAIQTLLDQLDRVQNKENQISQQSGEFSQKYKEQQQTALAQFKTAWSSIQASLIQFGDAILPSVTKAMQSAAKIISDLAGWFNGLSKGQKQFVVDAAGVIAAVGPVLLIFGTFAKSINEVLKLGKTIGSVLSTSFELVSDGAEGMTTIFTASIGSMALVVAGFIADIYLIIKAIKSVIDAFSDMSAAKKSAANEQTQKTAAISNMENLLQTGTPTQQADAMRSLQSLGVNVSGTQFASGTSYAPGGRTLVGEQGPEIMDMPKGARIYPTRQSASMMGGNTTHNHFSGNIMLGSSGAVNQFFKQLNTDSLLASKGFTIRQGN